MRWDNKGHQFDVEGRYFLEEFTKRKKVSIFGAGILGAEIQLVLERYDCFGGYIDNNVVKQKQGVNGYRVLSLEEFIKLNNNAWIVIAVDDKYLSEIEQQIKAYGLIINRDYFVHTHFIKYVFPLISMYFYDRLFVGLTQISVTERCTLRCKKCAHACAYVDRKSKDMDIATVCQSADVFFGIVDCVKEFVLIGGEPLLYRGLVEAIEYIGQNYREKMCIFSITTNGTITPSAELLDVCKKYDVLFRISNYSKNNPRLSEKYIELTKILKGGKVKYLLGLKEQEWMDYGFDHLNRAASEKELIRIFDTCRTPCSEIRDNKFYYCVMARSVAENMGKQVGENDYLDMTALNDKYGKKVMFEYTMGCSKKGYLDMCNYCYGADAHKYPIPAAEQM